MIRTIIIEDDPMVAQINCQYLQPLGDFQIDGIFNSGAAAQEYLKENEADESLSAALGLSKVTIRRYLNYLIEIQEMVSSIDYETGGRPRVLYLLKR